MRSLTIDQARRVALAAQGFHRSRPKGQVDVRHLRRVLDHTQVVQLDSVNVAVRAHYMPFFSRLGPYDRDRLDRWINGPELFEYWAHEASVLRVEDLPMLRYRMAALAKRPWGRVKSLIAEHPDYIDQVHAEVAENGPLTISDLSNPGRRTGPWWGYGRGKIALEWLYVTGRLATRGRTPTFKSIYDLPERVFPAEVIDDVLSTEDAHRTMLKRAVAAHGIATAADLADYYRISVRNARPRLAELTDAGHVIPVMIKGSNEAWYLDPGATRPRRVDTRALVAPFDPVAWARPRLERLFDFHYRIEIYVPEPKREYGYYVYPFLLGERFVARVDLKADRKAGILHAKGAFAEDGVDRRHVARELATELKIMAGWLGLDSVEIGTKGDLAAPLRSAL